MCVFPLLELIHACCEQLTCSPDRGLQSSQPGWKDWSISFARLKGCAGSQSRTWHWQCFPRHHRECEWGASRCPQRLQEPADCKQRCRRQHRRCEPLTVPSFKPEHAWCIVARPGHLADALQSDVSTVQLPAMQQCCSLQATDMTSLQIINMLSGKTGPHQIRQALQALVDEGHLYTTTDEYHFRAADC